MELKSLSGTVSATECRSICCQKIKSITPQRSSREKNHAPRTILITSNTWSDPRKLIVEQCVFVRARVCSDIIKFCPIGLELSTYGRWFFALSARRRARTLYLFIIYQQAGGPLSMQGYIGWPLAAAAHCCPACVQNMQILSLCIKIQRGWQFGESPRALFKSNKQKIKRAWKWKLNTMPEFSKGKPLTWAGARTYTKRQMHIHNWSRKNGTGPSFK